MNANDWINDWSDDAENVRDAQRVEIGWTAYDQHGNITFRSDAVITGKQAEAMFRGIANAPH